MSYVLGIDGGGTKTTGVIANERCEILAEITLGASNPNLVSERELLQLFSVMKEQFLQENMLAFHKVTHIFAGVSGAAHPHTKQTLEKLLRQVMPHISNITVDHDAIIALFAGTRGNPGIAQISGTGSVTFGMNSRGERGRVGGWGHFIGDKGSGYSIGHDALKAVFASYDGLASKTRLQDDLLHFFKESSLPSLIPHIYQTTNPKETIASITKLVMAAADKGDQVAKDIIANNGRHIGKSIATLNKKLFHQDEDNQELLPVVLVGGLFHRYDLFEESIQEELQWIERQTTLIKLSDPPVIGAVIAALASKRI